MTRTEGALAIDVDLRVSASAVDVTVRSGESSFEDTYAANPRIEVLVPRAPVGLASIELKARAERDVVVAAAKRDVQIIQDQTTRVEILLGAAQDAGPADREISTDVLAVDSGPPTYTSAPISVEIRSLRGDSITGGVLSGTADLGDALSSFLSSATSVLGAEPSAYRLSAASLELSRGISQVASLAELFNGEVVVFAEGRDSQARVDLARGPLGALAPTADSLAPIQGELTSGRIQLGVRGSTSKERSSGFEADVRLTTTWLAIR
ncbi:MAG: hypothetical protein HYV07_13180 [Deltaproteobacteria bacterium]|nr:hypothetical protein [Deltaproteobacteria bacterium]